MTDPFALLPLAAAAGGGRVDAFEAQQLVAAGFTLLQRSAPLVRALAGRRAAILLPTSPAFLTALAACEGRGAVLVNPLASAYEVAYQLADAGVGAVLTTTALAAKLPAGITTVLVDDAPRTARVLAAGTSRDVDLGSHRGLEIEGSLEAPGSDEEAVVVYTSAMAGTPLGAVLTHRNLIANARATVEAAANTPLDHVLAALPFSHLFGLTVSGMAPLFAGARVTTMERFHPIRAAELLASGGITALVGVPAMFKAVLQAIARKGGRLRSETLRLCICGGALLPEEVQERWAEATGVELRQGYGLTECGPVCLFNRVDLPNRRGTVGVPLPGVEVAIRTPLPAGGVAAERTVTMRRDGEEGEVCVRGDSVSPGYLSGGERGLRREAGWLHTGDLGVRSADGTVAFRGVCKAMFTRNGFNVYPREVESAVAELPGVRAVTARAIPEPMREHDIALEVVGDVTIEAVTAWCKRRLSAYEWPSEIVVVRDEGRGKSDEPT